MKIAVCFLLVAFCWHEVYCAMSEQQMKAAMKLIRNVCQPKTKATNEQIEAMHKGDWNQDKAGACYNWCILNMYHLISKENVFLWEAAVDTINNQAPESMRASATKSITSCKDAVKTPGDKCAASLEVTQCIYMADPEKYFLP